MEIVKQPNEEDEFSLAVEVEIMKVIQNYENVPPDASLKAFTENRVEVIEEARDRIVKLAEKHYQK